MRFHSILILIFIITTELFSQNNSIGNKDQQSFTFLPDGLQFTPLKANIHEARIGVFKSIDNSGMKVDLGNSIDLFQYNTDTGEICFRAGIDFFAFAFVKSMDGLRLQIDALDGFFGGNLSAAKQIGGDELSTRLRILHQSAHLVDGHYKNGGWIDNLLPIPYTRDFGELVVAHKISSAAEQIRYYGGVSYATLVRPAEIKRVAGLCGVEISSQQLFNTLFAKPISPFLAYNLTLNSTQKYIPSHQVQFGIKFGNLYEKGMNFFIAYYSGRHIFAEYFNQRLTIVGLGFTVDF